jgi:hypothetical protein
MNVGGITALVGLLDFSWWSNSPTGSVRILLKWRPVSGG